MRRGADPEGTDLFTGALAGYAKRFVWGEAPGMPTARDLLEPGVLDGLLARFEAAHGGLERPAAASFWSQIYFGALVVPAAVYGVAAGRTLALGLDETRLAVCGRSGAVLAFHLAHPDRSHDGVEPIGALLNDHVAPMIEGVRRQTGLSRTLLWENLGWPLMWSLAEVARMGPEQAGRVEAILATRPWPDAAAPNLERMRRAAWGESGGTRRVCCLRYRIASMGRCAGLCPRTYASDVLLSALKRAD